MPARNGSTEIHRLDPHRSPPARGIRHLEHASPGPGGNPQRKWPHIWRQRLQLGRQRGQVRQGYRVARHDPNRSREPAPRFRKVSRPKGHHACPGHGIVGRRVLHDRPLQEVSCLGQPPSPHRGVASTGERARIIRTGRQRAIEFCCRHGDVVSAICGPPSFRRGPAEDACPAYGSPLRAYRMRTQKQYASRSNAEPQLKTHVSCLGDEVKRQS